MPLFFGSPSRLHLRPIAALQLSSEPPPRPFRMQRQYLESSTSPACITYWLHGGSNKPTSNNRYDTPMRAYKWSRSSELIYADTSNLVSWQSAYWGLVPLAINVMAQPSGRICGFNSRWRFYLRSSPIVCVVDLVALLLRFIILLFRGHSFAEAMGYTLESRELHLAADPVGVQAIEKVPVLRFIIFVFTLLQAVKLLSCTGIPWTQTWAFFYLIPWCVYE